MNVPARKPAYSDSFVKIQAFWYDITGTVKLSVEHKIILERWSFADSLIRMDYVDETCVPDILRKKFPSISRSTAYDDLRNAKKLFGSTSLEDQMYFSSVHYSYALDLFKRCRAKGQLMAAQQALKLMHEIKGSGLDSMQDEAMRDLAKSVEESRVIYVVTNPEAVGLKKYDAEYIDRLKKEMMSKTEKIGEYTPYEELSDGKGKR